MVVAGVMSGTSADGVDVAICRVSPGPKVKVLGHRAFAYDAKLRAAVLGAMDAKTISAAELARLSWRLGAVYAECVETTARELKVRPRSMRVPMCGVLGRLAKLRCLRSRCVCRW